MNYKSETYESQGSSAMPRGLSSVVNRTTFCTVEFASLKRFLLMVESLLHVQYKVFC